MLQHHAIDVNKYTMENFKLTDIAPKTLKDASLGNAHLSAESVLSALNIIVDSTPPPTNN